MSVKKGNNGLEGNAFVNFDKEGFFHQQGTVIGEVSNGVFLVQFFSWLDGSVTNRKLVNISDMMDWNFFRSEEDLIFYVECRHKDKNRFLAEEQE